MKNMLILLLGLICLIAATPSSQVAPGTVIAFAGPTCPPGTIAADGTSYLRTLYPSLYTAIGNSSGSADGTHFNVPDYRGRFMRGTDGGTARDPDVSGRTAMNTGGNVTSGVGSVQGYQIQSHQHGITVATGTFTVGAGGAVNVAYPYTTGNTDNAGGNETRPINAYVNYCIKY